jgi:predicted dinucleotide-binding enzyme
LFKRSPSIAEGDALYCCHVHNCNHRGDIHAGSGAYSGTVADAAFFGEIILFSPNFWSVDDALKAAGPLKGKTVVDVTNPLELNPNDRMVRSLSWSTTAGNLLAQSCWERLGKMTGFSAGF